jgi:hypothetical protein
MKDVHHIEMFGLRALESISEHYHRVGVRVIITILEPESMQPLGASASSIN